MQPQINEQVQVETAEGISIALQPAGFAARTLAFGFDSLLRLGAFIAVSMIFGLLGDFGYGLMLISIFVIEWFYPILFEYFTGTTPGKKMLGLKVVYSNGLPLTLPGAMTRNLFRVIDFLPFGYLAGLISILMTRRFQRIGDWVAGTMVVYQHKTKVYYVPQSDLNYLPPFSLKTQEQIAVIRFAERTKTLSQARVDELANILSPFIKHDASCAECLKSLANRYTGKS